MKKGSRMSLPGVRGTFIHQSWMKKSKYQKSPNVHSHRKNNQQLLAPPWNRLHTQNCQQKDKGEKIENEAVAKLVPARIEIHQQEKHRQEAGREKRYCQPAILFVSECQECKH